MSPASVVSDLRVMLRYTNAPTLSSEERPQLELDIALAISILPGHPKAYIRALIQLIQYAGSDSSERADAALLEGDAPSPDVASLSEPRHDVQETAAATHARANEILHSRNNECDQQSQGKGAIHRSLDVKVCHLQPLESSPKGNLASQAFRCWDLVEISLSVRRSYLRYLMRLSAWHTVPLILSCVLNFSFSKRRTCSRIYNPTNSHASGDLSSIAVNVQLRSPQSCESSAMHALLAPHGCAGRLQSFLWSYDHCR